MANTVETRKKAGLKAKRSDARKASRNASTRGAIEVQERMMRKALESKDSNAIETVRRGLQKLYDKATKKNVIHKKTADRRKSRLAKRIKKVS